MSEIKITKDSLENAILKDGQFVSGYVASTGYISADGDGAHAEGYIDGGGSINVSGNGAYAHGYAEAGSINAKGNGAHAEGYVSGSFIDASGNGAHAEGISTQALADGAHAGGIGTIANQEAMNAIGKYNVSSNTENTLFVVGDGSTSLIRSDAFRVNSLGSETGDNLVPSSVQAKVNGIPDVYLGCPIGTIVMWAGETAPEGWLLCDGGAYTISQYQNLYNVIGIKYGGSTVNNTFLVPNLQQRFPLGAKDNSYVGRASYSTILIPASGNEKMQSYYGEIKTNTLLDLSHVQIEEKKQGTGNYYVIVSYQTYSVTSQGVIYNQIIVKQCDDKMNITDPTERDFRNLFNNDQTGHDISTIYVYDIYKSDIGYVGGESEHRLSISEINHLHYSEAIAGTSGNISYDDKQGNKVLSNEIIQNGFKQIVGHNNIPPYLAINFIIKYK